MSNNLIDIDFNITLTCHINDIEMFNALTNESISYKEYLQLDDKSSYCLKSFKDLLEKSQHLHIEDYTVFDLP